MDRNDCFLAGLIEIAMFGWLMNSAEEQGKKMAYKEMEERSQRDEINSLKRELNELRNRRSY